ncbi:transporter substrate-binding domain-containing protein [Piscirickettsia litoralis]|uniref:transporter substrate-binding domain-containing protein n=1 Tax=Piscirickettsia litoralis TaxID=1891921 RepID=UPI00130115E6|nr:transporter substrate-binding domain-containing protein [Piscirickettsia litoralis]
MSFAKLIIITEQYPPFNYKDTTKKAGKKQQLTGIAVDILKQTYLNAGLKLNLNDIKILPWSRGYYLAQQAHLTNMLFSTARTKEREDLFKWVGPIVADYTSVYALKRKK